MTEVEFYLYHEPNFQDTACHQNEFQLTNQHWYVHRYKKSLKMRSLGRTGLDLTCGDGSDVIYGGILLRAIMNVNDHNEYVNGPANVVNQFMNELKWEEKEQLESIETEDIFENSYIKIAEAGHLEVKKVIECPRVRLGKNASIDYRMEPFRFLIYGARPHDEKEKTIFPYLNRTYHGRNEEFKLEFKRKTI